MTRRTTRQPDAMAQVLKLIPARWALTLLAILIVYILLQPQLNAWLGWNLPSIPSMLGGQESPQQRTPPPVRENDATRKSPPSELLKFGILKPLGQDRFESPAGLVYAPGSEQGHRLQHIERHLIDDPKRPGPHGVFEGTMQEFLSAIDDTFRRARGHAKGTKQRQDEGATIYEAPFEEPIGFLGGTEGKERGHPKLQRMRIVVRGKNLITGFPIR